MPLGDRTSPHLDQREQANDTNLEAIPVTDENAFLADGDQQTIGISVGVSGKLAWPLLAPEAGVHVFARKGRAPSRCLVHVSDAEMRKYQPPPRIDRRGTIGSQPLRRTYDAAGDAIDDRRLDNRSYWSGRDLAGQVPALIDENFLNQVKAWIRG